MVSGEVRIARDARGPEWNVVFGDRFVLALPFGPDAAAEAAAALTSADAPAHELEQVISRIPLGVGGVDDFALVWWPPDDGRVTAVVRGTAAVDLTLAGGRRRLDAVGIRPWHLAEFRDVRAFRIGPALGGDVAWSEVSMPEPAVPLRVTSFEWRTTFGAPATEPITMQIAAGSDGDSRSSEDPAALTPTYAAWFRVPGGVAREVDSVVLIGRRPSPPRIVREAVELVRVAPSATAVSATHLELRRAGARLVATDLRSTNGTVVRTPSGSRRMRAGESIVVAAGSMLELGGDTIVEILPPPQDQAHPDRQVPA